MKKLLLSLVLTAAFFGLLIVAQSPAFAETPSAPKVIDAYTSKDGKDVYIVFDQELDQTTLTQTNFVVRFVDKFNFSQDKSTENPIYSSSDTVKLTIKASAGYIQADGTVSIAIKANSVLNKDGLLGNEHVYERVVKNLVPSHTVTTTVYHDNVVIAADDLIFFASDFGSSTVTLDLVFQVNDPRGQPVEGLNASLDAPTAITTKQTDDTGTVRFDGVTLDSQFHFLKIDNVPNQPMYLVPEGYSFLTVEFNDFPSIRSFDGIGPSYYDLYPIDENNKSNSSYTYDALRTQLKEYLIVNPKTKALENITSFHFPDRYRSIYHKIPVNLTSNEQYVYPVNNLNYRNKDAFTVLEKGTFPVDSELLSLDKVTVINAIDPTESYFYDPSIWPDKKLDVWILNGIDNENYKLMNIVLYGLMQEGTESAGFVHAADHVGAGDVVSLDFSLKQEIYETAPYDFGFGDYMYDNVTLRFVRLSDQTVLGQFSIFLWPQYPAGSGGILYELTGEAPKAHPVRSNFIYFSDYNGASYFHYFKNEFSENAALPIKRDTVGGSLTIEAEKPKLLKGDTQQFTLKAEDGTVLYRIEKYVAGYPVQNVQLQIKKDDQLIATVAGTSWTVPKEVSEGVYTAEIVDVFGFPVNGARKSVTFSVYAPSVPPIVTEQPNTITVQFGNVPIPIQRSTDPNGNVTDEVNITADFVKEAAAKLAEQGLNTAVIIIPDKEDQVSELIMTLSEDAVGELMSKGINIEIQTEHARLYIPADSLQNFRANLFFRFAPVKQEGGKRDIENRAKQDAAVARFARDPSTIRLLGRPMVIETNLQSRPMSLILLLTELPEDAAERGRLLRNPMVFIEHDDGSKELVKGTVVDYGDGKLGIKFEVQKFSTFTPMYLEEKPVHDPYIFGYPDGTFRPNGWMTRAEFAVMLSRLIGNGTIGSATAGFTDVPETHWAAEEISKVTAAGLLNGYPDGSFKPDREMTRAEAATVIAKWKSGQLIDDGEPTPWTDVSGHWAERSILRLAFAGWMLGDGTDRFRPNAPITRAEAVTIMNRVLGRGPLVGFNEPMWSDVPVTHWAYRHIIEASLKHEYVELDDGEQYMK